MKNQSMFTLWHFSRDFVQQITEHVIVAIGWAQDSQFRNQRFQL